ncbi:DUF3857 and transglutaminase domain-containing protein [candidate division WOR-3 bacterium]|nr:DUF3857 and transglutaminase domain-containing protein [candidate division WOR-3 bacterium]
MFIFYRKHKVLSFAFCVLSLGSLVLGLSFIGCAPKIRVPIDLIKEATKDMYQDANGVILFDSTYVKVEQDGKAVYTSHSLVKILKTYGKKKFGEQTFGYSTKIGTLIVNLARVITPEGEVISVPKENIKDMPFVPIEMGGSKMFFPDVRMVKIIFPNLEIGSSVEYIVTTYLRKGLMGDRFTDMSIFEAREPIRDIVYKLEFPKTMEMGYAIKNGELSFSKEEKENSKVYQWEAKDVPAIVEEPLMPSIWDVATKLVISNVPTWEEVSSWYYGLSESSFEADSAIKTKVSELTDTLKTQEQKVRALFNFISMEVRYLRTEAISKEKGIEPAPAPITFERKWGVCRDKAALLVSMLQEIGVPAYIVLVDVSRHTVPEVPTCLFEHAIVAIKNSDGSYYYLDPTMEYATDYFPPLEQNRNLLLCSSEGDSLRFVPFINPEHNQILIQNTGKLDKDGNLEAIFIIKGEGFYDTQLRSFRYIPPEQRKQIFGQVVQSFSPEATLESLTVSDPADLSKPFTIEFSYKAPEYAIKKDGELHLISRASSSSSFSFGMGPGGGMGSPFGLSERKYPLYFWVPIRTKATTTLTLPKGYKVKKLPEDFEREHIRFYSKTTKRELKGKLIEQSEFFIKDPFIPIEDYKNLKGLMEDLEKYNKKEVILIKK